MFNIQCSIFNDKDVFYLFKEEFGEKLSSAVKNLYLCTKII